MKHLSRLACPRSRIDMYAGCRGGARGCGRLGLANVTTDPQRQLGPKPENFYAMHGCVLPACLIVIGNPPPAIASGLGPVSTKGVCFFFWKEHSARTATAVSRVHDRALRRNRMPRSLPAPLLQRNLGRYRWWCPREIRDVYVRAIDKILAACSPPATGQEYNRSPDEQNPAGWSPDRRR